MITKQIKIYLYIGGAIAIAILIISGINLNVAASASAQATANSKAIATAVSQANALSVAVSSARASAINNTYFINQRRMRGLEWKDAVHNLYVCQSYWWFRWSCKIKLKESIQLNYQSKPLPWMQRWLVVDATLYVGYFDKKVKKKKSSRERGQKLCDPTRPDCDTSRW